MTFRKHGCVSDLPASTLRLDDLEVYRELQRSAARLDALSHRCWSTAAQTALQSGSAALKHLASALYRNSLQPSEP